ncbi:hypothetical protein [Viridibacillus arvi]|uniref:hypothetical protein n=1 Tax=Viridibacillus arvi TaxID=263475 RepID=UPI0034CEA053
MEESRMLYKEELERIAKTKGLTLVNGQIDIDSEKDNQIEIPILEDFLDFHQHVENKLLFYTYSYTKEESFLIPVDDYQNYNDAIQGQLNLEILEYNKSLKDINFEEPADLLMYYIKEGFLFFNFTENNKISELCTPEDMVNIIVEEVADQIPEDKFKEILDKAQANRDKQKQELKEVIFADPDFKNSTNLHLRRNYSNQFFHSHPEYREFLRDIGYYMPISFIESIWKEFKDKGLHK